MKAREIRGHLRCIRFDFHRHVSGLIRLQCLGQSLEAARSLAGIGVTHNKIAHRFHSIDDILQCLHFRDCNTDLNGKVPRLLCRSGEERCADDVNTIGTMFLFRLSTHVKYACAIVRSHMPRGLTFAGV